MLLLSAAGCRDADSGAGGGEVAAGTELEPADPRIDAALTSIQEGRFAEAREKLEGVLKEKPGSGRAAFFLALAYHKEKRYSPAKALFERVIERGPTFKEQNQAHHFHGWCLYNLGQLAGARRAFERHLELEPNAADSHFALGLIDLDDGRLDAAESRFRRAIELESANPERRREAARARVRLADVYMERDELAKAKAELRLAVELWPAHYPAYHKLHHVLTRLGEPEAAAEALRLHALWRERARPSSVTPTGPGD